MLSEFKLHWFFEFICNWSVKKNKDPPHADRFSPPLKTISNKWVGIKKDQNSQCFRFSPFDLIMEDRMPLCLYSPLAYPSIKNYNHFRILNLNIERCLSLFLLFLTLTHPVILVVPLPVDYNNHDQTPFTMSLMVSVQYIIRKRKLI